VKVVLVLVSRVEASDDEERLMADVFRGYNSLIQPVRNLSDRPLIVKMALQLCLLIDVDEKDQVMRTNIWLTIRWKVVFIISYQHGERHPLDRHPLGQPNLLPMPFFYFY
jgi:hypothetical protein